MYGKPIELRITRHPNGGYTFYTVLKVFEGIGNTAHVGTKFMTRSDATAWCKREYPAAPRIFE
jgi:hypothetical protein